MRAGDVCRFRDYKHWLYHSGGTVGVLAVYARVD
jgi:hypothetical protein